jgi:uncharacterized membrane protein
MIFFVFFQCFSILAVSMATAAILKKSPLKSSTSHDLIFFYSFHQTSSNFVGISTVGYGSFGGLKKIQDGSRCHGHMVQHVLLPVISISIEIFSFLNLFLFFLFLYWRLF